MQPLTILEGIGLGALQGVTEFLPISSSGHLVLARALFGIREAPVTVEVALHAASLVAICIFFWREILSVFTTRRGLIPALIVGTLPAAVLGVLLKDRIEALFDNPLWVAIGMLLTGTVLWVGERRATDAKPLDAVTPSDGFWIGVAQAIALVPGISRSGMTVSAGLASGLERGAAVAFAFLLGVIAIGGATVLKARAIASFAEAGVAPLALGCAASLVVSLAALGLLTFIVRRKCLRVFTIYCYLVGLAIVLAKLTGVW